MKQCAHTGAPSRQLSPSRRPAQLTPGTSPPPSAKCAVDPLNVIGSVLEEGRTPQQLRHTPSYSAWGARSGGAGISPRNPGTLTPAGVGVSSSKSPAPTPPVRVLPSRTSGEQRRLDNLARRRRSAALRAGLAEVDPSAPLWEREERGVTPVGLHTLNEIGKLKSALHTLPAASPTVEYADEEENTAARLAESGQQLLQGHRDLVETLRQHNQQPGVFDTHPPATAGPPALPPYLGVQQLALSPPVGVPRALGAVAYGGSPSEAREAALRAAAQPVFLPEEKGVAMTTGPTTTPGLPGWPSPQRTPLLHPPPSTSPQVWRQPYQSPNPRTRVEGMFGSEGSRRRLPPSPWDQSSEVVNQRVQGRPWAAYGGASQVFSQLFTSRGLSADPGGPAWGDIAPVLTDQSLLAATAALMRGVYLVRFVDAPRSHAAGERFFYITTGGDARRAEPELLWVSSEQRRYEVRGAQNRLRLSNIQRVTAGPDDSDILSDNLIVTPSGGEALAGPHEKLGRPLELNPAGSLTLTLCDGRTLDLCAASPTVFKDAARVFTAVVEANARAEALVARGGSGAVPNAFG
eukprot:Hpha_TRINITY_DN15594_c2_g10::TRINITY_DN15594_c2_g10_i1::g.107790::m.107790